MAEPQRSQVAAFYDNQTVFITGITGFLGKVLLAKLMAVAPNVRKVFLLIRGRRGKTAQVRFERDVLTTELFENLMKQYPNLKEKFVVCDGDISKPKLGLSTENTAAIENETSIILHCAATTRFTEPLKQAVELNTLGAQRILELAKRCPRLLSYIHVSTAYVNCIRGPTQEIREKIYPLHFNPFDMVEKIQAMSQEQADLDTDKIIAPWPNTYTFTKAMTEHILLTERGNLPLAIVRPSIVGCGWVDPVPGWVDSAIGASGLILANGVGALRAMRGAAWHVADIIPVDIVSSGILCSAWRTYVQYKEAAAAAADQSGSVVDSKGSKADASRRPPLPIYHYTSSVKNPVTWGWIRDITGGFFQRHPPKKRVGKPGTLFIPNPIAHAVANAALHFAPAALLDAQRVATGKKARMLKATYILHKAIKTIGFFPNNQWFYANDNVDLLLDEMSEEDKKLFRIDVREMNWELYLIIYSEGLRKYLLKEGPMSDDDIGPRLRLRISGDDIGTGIGPGPMKSRL